jgi:flagellum-specific peptidoglycan hydrolase FlgJ
LFFPALVSFNYTPEESANRYIEKYRDLAVVEMYRTGIPASITLAQGLHESNYGMSPLATRAKNHFGIKCKSNWQGETYFHKDDDYDRNGVLTESCFRAYESDIDSYVDHSNFLKYRSLYASLFVYEPTDYQNWAHGLQKCGYATDKKYAEKLITKITRFNLDQYDFWKNPLTR